MPKDETDLGYIESFGFGTPEAAAKRLRELTETAIAALPVHIINGLAYHLSIALFSEAGLMTGLEEEFDSERKIRDRRRGFAIVRGKKEVGISANA